MEFKRTEIRLLYGKDDHDINYEKITEFQASKQYMELVHVQDVNQLDPDIWNYINNPVGTELIRISSNEFEIDKKDKKY